MGCQVRQATADDIPACAEMGRRFFDESGFSAETSFDPLSFEVTLRQLIASKDGVVLVADGGMVGGLAYPFYFNANSKTAQEMFWWVSPEYRGTNLGMLLIDGFERWARSKGCETLSMICLPALRESPAERVYQRRGYRASERVYIKRL